MWLKADVSERCNHLKATLGWTSKWPFTWLTSDNDCWNEAQLRFLYDTQMWPMDVAPQCSHTSYMGAWRSSTSVLENKREAALLFWTQAWEHRPQLSIKEAKEFWSHLLKLPQDLKTLLVHPFYYVEEIKVQRIYMAYWRAQQWVTELRLESKSLHSSQSSSFYLITLGRPPLGQVFSLLSNWNQLWQN